MTEQDKQDIADIAEADLTPTILNAFPTDIASGSIASFSDGADNLPLKSLVVDINPIQDLHGQESPYPAGGGKNLFNGTFLQGYWAYANGAWTSDTKWIATEKIPCKPSTYYTASADNRQTRWQGFVYYDNNGDYISTQNLSNKVPVGYTAQTPANAAYLIFNIAGKSETLDPISPSDVTHFQLEEGQTATSYAPYSNICPISGWTGMQLNANGTVIPISWQTEAGTVYGGTLDLVSGLLTINRTTVNTTWGSGINATNLGYVTQKRFNLDNPSKKYYTDAANDLKSNVIGQYNTLYSGDYVHMYLASTTHIWAYMPSNTAADTVMQFSYTLETPVTYQLTPTEVKTLLGVNNIFADTGDTTAEYRADPDLYIHRKMPEVPVDDVQINGSSIVVDGVAKIPIASANALGLVKIDSGSAVGKKADGTLGVIPASISDIKTGIQNIYPITSGRQQYSTFYGLAKAAGDTTQSQSSNAVGVYTEDAKSKISEMLGGSVAVSGTTPTIVAKSGIRYVCGEVATLDFTPCQTGICDVVFTSGSTPTVVTLPSTVKFPDGAFTAEADTTYEINILDGIYGAVMAWT